MGGWGRGKRPALPPGALLHAVQDSTSSPPDRGVTKGMPVFFTCHCLRRKLAAALRLRLSSLSLTKLRERLGEYGDAEAGDSLEETLEGVEMGVTGDEEVDEEEEEDKEEDGEDGDEVEA